MGIPYITSQMFWEVAILPNNKHDWISVRKWEDEKAGACIPVVGGGGKGDMAPKDTGVERRWPSRGKEGAPEDPRGALTSTPNILV